MKKNTIIILLAMCLVFTSVTVVFANTNVSQPSLVLSNLQGVIDKWVGETLAMTVKFDNIKQINKCIIKLKYNTEVLEIKEIASYAGEACEYGGHIYEGDTGEIYIQISRNDNFKCGCNKKDLGGVNFSVIGVGDTGFSTEIVTNDCLDGKEIIPELSGLCTSTKEDSSMIKLSLEDGSLTISGTGRVIKEIEEYDIENVIPEDKNEITSMVVENGIEIINNNTIMDYSNLTDLWLPDSVKYIGYYSIINDKTIIHANGMTYAENIASEHDLSFELNEGFTVGDLNSDGSFNSKDALGILKMAAKLEPLYKWSADADGNGSVNAQDALWVLKKAAKIE